MNNSIKIRSLILLFTITIYVNYVTCECNSDTLRDFAVDACHITKRSAHFRSSHFKQEGYEVEHVTPKHRYGHHKLLSHTKKLTREDFPSGGYLLVHPVDKYIRNDIDYHTNIDSQEEFLANEILTMDMRPNHDGHHKNKHSYRFRRNSGSAVLIEHCCSQAQADICGKYFCH